MQSVQAGGCCRRRYVLLREPKIVAEVVSLRVFYLEGFWDLGLFGRNLALFRLFWVWLASKAVEFMGFGMAAWRGWMKGLSTNELRYSLPAVPMQ